jgi:hypothetical protein
VVAKIRIMKNPEPGESGFSVFTLMSSGETLFVSF